MEKISIFRKRFIPNETIYLKDDIILEQTDDIIVTRWNALNPKIDLDHGFSCYYLKKGIKISKFFHKNNTLLYWYCDIVDYDFQPSQNKLTVSDLLADVIIQPDGSYRVVDLDELAQASKQKLISQEQLHTALIHLDDLLNIIYQQKFSDLTEPIERYCGKLVNRFI